MAMPVSRGRGLVPMDALDELGYRGYRSCKISVLGLKSACRLGVSELDQ